VYVAGSCLCDGRELRLTKRCLIEDFDVSENTPFGQVSKNAIVRALENQRCEDPLGTKTIGPEAGKHTIYRLAYGDRHRGATWFDEAENVVWLCAYGLHESGNPDDAFPYFHELIADKRMLPKEEDYEGLFTDRGNRFAATVGGDVQLLLAEARSDPGVEHQGLVGGEQTAGVLVEVVDTLQETYVCLSLASIDATKILVLLAAFFPDNEFSDWELVDNLPTRVVRTADGEICYRIFHENQ
jgi:hypothetical protein